MSVSRVISRTLVKDILDPLTKRGETVSPDVKVVPDDRPRPIPEQSKPPEEPVIEQRVEEPPVVEEPELTTQQAIDETPPVDESVAERVMADRMAITEEDPDRQVAPSPTPLQKEKGVEKGRVNTTFYDEAGLRATIEATAATLPDVGSRTIQSFYDDVAERGIATNVLDEVFKNKSVTSTIGNNALSTQMAALITIHDASLVRIDSMMARAVNGQLDTDGKVKLREALAQHDIILQQLTAAKTDIARSMNVFKGAGDGASKTLTIKQQQKILDQFGGDDQLRVLAEKWIKAPTTKAKNKLVEVSLFNKTIDAILYTARSSLLTDPNTHLFNAAGTTILLAADMAERSAAIGVGALANQVRKLIGKEPRERMTAIDVSTRAGAIFNGVLDGWRMMADGFKQRDVQAKDTPRITLSAEYLSNTKIGELRGKVYRTGELKNTMIGRVLDGMGMLHSVPFRLIAAADGFFGGIAQRMELHEQAQRIGLNTYFDALDAGSTPAEAMSLAQTATGKLLSEQPASVAASVDGFRRVATLQNNIDANTPASFLYTGSAKLLNARPIQAITLFNRTLLNIADQGAARTPGANFVSPQFWADWRQGGKQRDLAMARVGVGTGMLMGGYQLAEMGRFTGAGPVQPSDRDTFLAQGFLPFSIVLGSDEKLSAPMIEKLKEILGEDAIKIGSGDLEGKTFISLKKLEPVTMPLLIGASISQALRYSDYDDSTMGGLQAMVSAGVSATYQTASNFPQTQLIAELYRIISTQQVKEDEGEKFVRAIDALVSTYSNTLISGTPLIGLANGALAARIERYIHPDYSETGIRQAQADWADNVLGIDIKNPGFRAFGEAYNRLLSRTPFLSKDLPIRLNEYGETIAPDLTTLNNFGPRMKAGEGSLQSDMAQVKAYLAAINHGFGRLPRNLKFKGYTLTAEQRNEFIDQYANKIKIDGLTLAQTILQNARTLIDDVAVSGDPFPLGLAQQEVNNTLSDFRAEARKAMFGKFKVDKESRIVEKVGETMYPGATREMIESQMEKLFKGN